MVVQWKLRDSNDNIQPLSKQSNSQVHREIIISMICVLL